MSASRQISLPNLLSFFRLTLGLVIPVLILWGGKENLTIVWPFWTAFCLFLTGAMTDFWDGWLARKRREETPLGRILDPTADKVFILGTLAGFAARGMYSYWYLVPIFLREIAVTFCRVAWLSKGHAIGAERAGKVKFVLQVTSALFSFAYIGLPMPATFYANYLFLVLALAATVYSGFSFFAHNQNLLVRNDFARTVAALGVGYLPPFPGTYGTLLGIAVLLMVSHDALLHILVFVTFLVLGYVAIARIGLRKEEDPLEIVIDEFCGILLAFWLVPISWRSLLLGFFLFRFFDVTKTFPISRLEKIGGVNGIMLDDIGAGIYTWLILKTFFK